MTNQIDRAAVLELLETTATGTIILGGQKYRTIQLEEIAAAIRTLPAAQVKVKPLAEPTEAQIASACLSYDHSFGLMDGPQRVALMHQAREWLHAWRKEFAATDLSPTAVDASQTPDPVMTDPLVKALVDPARKIDSNYVGDCECDECCLTRLDLSAALRAIGGEA